MSRQRPVGPDSSPRCCGLPGGWTQLAPLAVLVLAADRLTKVLIAERMPYGTAEAVIDGFFNLVHVRNTGIAFSMFADAPEWFRGTVLPLLSVAAIGVIVWMLARGGGLGGRSRYALALILAGAVGNLYDRLVFGYVVDFLDFYISGLHWPAFNVADSAITVGAGLLILDGFGAQRSQAPDSSSSA